MGKWSTYRHRRGTTIKHGPPAPPVPALYIEGGHVWQEPQGTADPGGYHLLFESYDDGATWNEADKVLWDPLYDWGEVAAYEGILIKAAEVGNGIVYEGQSEWSAPLDFR